MASIQERLQMKRVPLDTWSTREQLCLASSVVRSGDQNWMSVSRALKSLGDPSRPADWFSQKSCAAQYGSLLENVETPKRKKRTSDGAAETPQESILKKLTQERIAELQKLMSEATHTYAKIKDEIKEIRSPATSETRIRAMGVTLEAERRGREREAARRAQWLREREDRRALLERAWRRPDADQPHPSPLLTSLLQSPAPLHHPSPTDTVPPSTTAPSSGAPTLSLLLEKSSPAPSGSQEDMTLPVLSQKITVKSELQKIEQIKSELQAIENRVTSGTMPKESDILGVVPALANPPTPELPVNKETSVSDSIKTPEKVDIDDIEIKAEDVYAFSDIDLDIPPVSSMHKGLGRALHSDKNLFNKRDLSNISAIDDVASPASGGDSSEVLNSFLSPTSVQENAQPDVNQSGNNAVSQPQTDVNVLSPSNIIPDVIPEENTIKETVENVNNTESNNGEDNPVISENPSENYENPPNPEEDDSDREMNQKVSELKKDLEAKKSHESLFDKPEVNETEPEVTTTKDESSENTVSQNIEKTEVSQETVDKTSITSTQGEQQAEGHVETDDDTPIEVIKEDKPGKTKRDYSRKKADKDERATPPSEVEGVVSNKSEYSDEIGSDNSQGSADKKVLGRRFRSEASNNIFSLVSGSRSESPATPMDSLPGSPAPATPPSSAPHNPSPASSDQEKEYRNWKKSIQLAYGRLITLKYASLFLRPITDDQAPGYSSVVKRPMDLSTIRRNIDLGVIKTTAEFQRDVLLMLSNALMYNRTDHRVYAMACDTMREACGQLNVLLQAQGHAATPMPSASRLTRPPRPLSRATGTPKRKRGGGIGSGDSVSKKRRPDDS